MTIFRPQRGGWQESMAEAKNVETLRDLATLLGVDELTRITVTPYGWDARLEWDTYLVRVDGDVRGFTNGAL